MQTASLIHNVIVEMVHKMLIIMMSVNNGHYKWLELSEDELHGIVSVVNLISTCFRCSKKL